MDSLLYCGVCSHGLFSCFFFLTEYIEAGVRVLGCACDSDESMSLTWEEVSTDECVFVQNWVCHLAQRIQQPILKLETVNQI